MSNLHIAGSFLMEIPGDLSIIITKTNNAETFSMSRRRHGDTYFAFRNMLWRLMWEARLVFGLEFLF